MIHYPSLSSRQEPQNESLDSGHLAIPAKLHGPKGDRINESLLYSTAFTALIEPLYTQQNISGRFLLKICCPKSLFWTTNL